MQVAMLGPLEVRAGSGEVLEVGGARLRALLIMLAPGRGGRWREFLDAGSRAMARAASRVRQSPSGAAWSAPGCRARSVPYLAAGSPWVAIQVLAPGQERRTVPARVPSGAITCHAPSSVSARVCASCQPRPGGGQRHLAGHGGAATGVLEVGGQRRQCLDAGGVELLRR